MLFQRPLQASVSASRKFHSSTLRNAISPFRMPAMSPTMSEGGIASWKVNEGGTFTAGDVLLEIETDKATIDVEAQDDGILGKILIPAGSKNIPVGKTIALLAEEGDNITNLEVPEDTTPAPQPPEPRMVTQQSSSPPGPISYVQPTHSRPLFPSVQRLLVEHNVTEPGAIKGTGIRGMLTKGDVLAYLGKASSPTGTFNPSASVQNPVPQPAVKEQPKPLDGHSLRQIIVSSMLQSSLKSRTVSTVPSVVDFDSVIADYLPTKKTNPPAVAKASEDYFRDLL